jgi:ABC-type nitrate/sulfonate/bicarbonate transport system substrate-binding protein
LLVIYAAAMQPAWAENVNVRLAFIYQIHGAQMFDPMFVDRAKKRALAVEVVPMKRYPEVQLALATGQVDFGVFGFFNVGTLAENGITGVKVVAGNSTGGQGLILRKEVNQKVKTWKDLEGLRIGVAPNGSAHNIFRTLVNEKGVNLNKIDQVSFQGMGPEAVQALKSGQLDGLLAWEPTLARAVVEGFADYSVLKLEESPTGNINGALAVRTEFAEKHPEATVNMLRTLAETTDYLKANHEEWIKLAAAKTGVGGAVVKQAIPHLTIHYTMPIGKIKAMMDLMADFGITKKNHREAVDRYVDYSYLEKATGKSKKELGGE